MFLRRLASATRAAALPRRLAARAVPRFEAAPALSRGFCAPPSGDVPTPTPEPGVGAVHEAREDASFAFESPIYARFVNMMMKQGKKQTARTLLWRTFGRLRDGGHDPQEVFYAALENVRPLMEMRTMNAGPVPYPLTPHRAEGKAMKWIIASARKASGASFDVRLSRELLAAFQYKGGAMARRESVHKTALANQAAAHFRWRAGTQRPPGSIDMNRKDYRPQGRRAIKRLQGAFKD